MYFLTACVVILVRVALGNATSQCTNYTILSEKFRNINSRPKQVRRCDDKLARVAWYRFSGDAGTMMPSTLVYTHGCSTNEPGWVNGSHPRRLNTSTAARVCFGYKNRACRASVEITITDCGQFYVYKLPRVSCYKVYCGHVGVKQNVTSSPTPTQTPMTTRSSRTNSASPDVPVKGDDACPEEENKGETWPTTKVGVSYLYPCVYGEGFVKRHCSNSGWNEVEYTNCTSMSPEMDALYREVRELRDPNMTHEARSKAAENAINKLANITNLDDKHGEKGLSENELVYSVRMLRGIIQMNISNASLNVLQPASNILDLRNKRTFDNVKNSSEVISNLVVSLDDYGFQLGREMAAEMADNDSMAIQTKPNLELHVRVRIIKSKSNVTLHYTQFRLTNASFELSPSAFHTASNNATAIAVVLHYNTLHSLLAKGKLHREQTVGRINSDTEYVLNNDIITASVRPRPPPEFEKPVRIIWKKKHLFDDSTECVFWKPSEMVESIWSTKGCRKLVQQSNNIICECNHMTAFASMDISDKVESKQHKQALEIISTIGCSLSLVGIILTIVSYMIFWKKLHARTQTEVRPRVLMHLCIAVGMTDIFAILAGPAQNNKMFCTVVSISLYFFVLSVFGWMLCEGIVIYLLLVRIFSGLGGRHLRVFYGIGWGIPAIVVALSVGLVSKEKFITEYACWFRASGILLWIFVGLTGVTLLINIAVFILVLKNMFSSHNLNRAGGLDKAKAGMKATAVLLPLLGLTWSFGLMVFNSDTLVFKYLFAIFNSLQGLMIFVFHVLINKQLHDAMRKQRNINTTRRRLPNTVLSNQRKCGTLSTSDTNFTMNLKETGHHPRVSQHKQSRRGTNSSALLVIMNENKNESDDTRKGSVCEDLQAYKT